VSPPRCPSAAATWILSAALATAQSGLPPDQFPPNSPRPADPEETGGLLHILPGRTDPLTLPSESPPNSGSLFPPQLWPAAPPPTAESANPPTAEEPTPAGPAHGSDSPWSRESLLADPFGTLSSITRAHLESLLGDAAAKSGTTLHCLVVPDSSSLPESWDPTSWIETNYLDRPAISVIIPVNAPGQAQLHPSKGAAIRWNHSQLSATVAACASAASAVPGPDASTSRFLLHLLTEVNSARPPDPSPSVPLLSPNTGSARWWLTIVGGQFLAIGLGALWWHTRQRRHAARTPLVLSVFPSTPRFGAPYCGGHSSSVRFRPAKPSA
jgi:hypothetical protein